MKSVKKFSKKQSSELVPVKSKKRPFSMTSIRTMKASIICWLGPLEWLEFRQMNSLKQKIESSVVVDIDKQIINNNPRKLGRGGVVLEEPLLVTRLKKDLRLRKLLRH